ncbi:hypothetical protein ACFY5F_01760 [Streptomyces sp. NPDC013161]
MQQWLDVLSGVGDVLNLVAVLTDLVTAVLDNRRRRRTTDG